MIALFDEPYRVTINKPEVAGGSRNGLLLGVSEDDENPLHGVVLLEDGSVSYIQSTFFTIDYRYNVEIDRWMDVNRPADAQEE